MLLNILLITVSIISFSRCIPASQVSVDNKMEFSAKDIQISFYGNVHESWITIKQVNKYLLEEIKENIHLDRIPLDQEYMNQNLSVKLNSPVLIYKNSKFVCLDSIKSFNLYRLTDVHNLWFELFNEDTLDIDRIYIILNNADDAHFFKKEIKFNDMKNSTIENKIYDKVFEHASKLRSNKNRDNLSSDIINGSKTSIWNLVDESNLGEIRIGYCKYIDSKVFGCLSSYLFLFKFNGLIYSQKCSDINAFQIIKCREDYIIIVTEGHCCTGGWGKVAYFYNNGFLDVFKSDFSLAD